MVCFRDLPVAKKFMSKTGLGVSSFSVEIFLSHSSESFRRGILQWFINFGYRRMLGIKGGGGGLRLSVEVVLSQCTEAFRRSTLLCCVPEIFR